MSRFGLLVSGLQTRTLGIGQHGAGHALVFDDIYVVRGLSNVFSLESDGDYVGASVNGSIFNSVGSISVIVLVNSTKGVSVGVSNLSNEGVSSLADRLSELVSCLDGKVGGYVGFTTLDTRTIDLTKLGISA